MAGRRHKENQTATKAERGHDLYETHPVAVPPVLEVEWLPDHVWEPACGPGVIVRILREQGFKVTATDLIDYGLEDSTGGIDFLQVKEVPPGVGAIFTNPPFGLANEFIRHALRLVPRVIMLLPMSYLCGQKRTPLLEGGSFARVHVFRERIPMMHRAGWTGKKASSQVNYGWFVWDKSHFGPPIINRISIAK